MEPPGLGVGIVWWPPLDALCREGEELVDVIEAEPEAFWVPASDGRSFRSFLGHALDHLPQPKLLHGVGAPVGGTCSPPKGHAAALARDVEELHPEFVSEHLSLTQFRPRRDDPPVFAGFMLPPVQSRAGVELAAGNIRRHRAALGGIPLVVETAASYLLPAPGEWLDGDFVTAVVETAECGILLDLHNALCNARNGRQSVTAFCDALPLERVWELHLAGGEREAGFCVDAHAGLVEPELMEIAAALVPRLPQLRAMIFEIMPERAADVGLAAIARQLGRMKDLWNTRGSCHEGDVYTTRAWPLTEPPLDPEAWEMLLGCAVTGLPQPTMEGAAAGWWRLAAPALDLYRMLAGEGRASAVASAAPRTTRLLLQERGGPGTRSILAEFWRESPPRYTSADEARAFFRYLSEAYRTLPGLADAVASDAAELAGF